MSNVPRSEDADDLEVVRGPGEQVPDNADLDPHDVRSGGLGTVAGTTGPTPLTGAQILSTTEDETDPTA